MKRITYLDAAYDVLRQERRPMHHRDIYKEVVRKRLWVSNAQPQNVENSTYGTLIKAVQDGDVRFGRDTNDLAMFFVR